MTKKEENFFQKFSGSLTVENIRQRVDWLIILRWIAGVATVVTVLSARAFLEIRNIGIPLTLGVLILGYNLVFYFVCKYFMSHPETTSQTAIHRRIAFINIQIMIDLVVLAILIYFTGGIANPFITFFIFHMVIGSILLSRAKAFFWAFFTIVMESILFYLELYHYIPHQPFLPGYPKAMVEHGNYVLFILIAFSVTLIITVYFATSIMRPIRKRQLDLTELQQRLKTKRDLLEKSNKELSDMDRSKTEFLYRVEHELKAPIGALQSLISVVTRGYSSVDEDKKKELLARAETRITMMKELVNDLLSLSRVSERSFKLELKKIDPVELLREVVDDLESYSQKKEIPIKLDIHSDMPKIKADRLAVIEIFRNLIHNAIKYSFQGEVEVTLNKHRDTIELIVQDHGIGISEEDMGNVFSEFYRTANAKAFEEGTGLGLSLVKRLVEQHGGTIEVASQLNKGTTFTVSLPIESHDLHQDSTDKVLPETQPEDSETDDGETNEHID